MNTVYSNPTPNHRIIKLGKSEIRIEPYTENIVHFTKVGKLTGCCIQVKRLKGEIKT